MNKKVIKEFEKRYDKFKGYNLPTSFWDKERHTLEYVYFDDDDLRVNYSLYESLGDIALVGLYYSFTSGYMTGNTTEGFHYEVGHNHAHSFEEVVRWLYDYPESFSISKDEEEFYSKQELDYLKNVKEYLLFIGLKDCKGNNRSKSRFKNKKQEKYKHYGMTNVSDELAKKILSGKRDYMVIHTEYPEYYPDIKEYQKNEYISFARNKEGKIISQIEYTKELKKTYREFKKEFNETINDYYTNKELKNTDWVIIRYFKILKKY